MSGETPILKLQLHDVAGRFCVERFTSAICMLLWIFHFWGCSFFVPYTCM